MFKEDERGREKRMSSTSLLRLFFYCIENLKPNQKLNSKAFSIVLALV